MFGFLDDGVMDAVFGYILGIFVISAFFAVLHMISGGSVSSQNDITREFVSWFQDTPNTSSDSETYYA